MNQPIDRRDALAAFGVMGAAALAGSAFGQPQSPLKGFPTPAEKPGMTPQQMGFDPDSGEYVLPPLPYAKNALEPHIDAQTMEIHHDKHHASYVAGANKALKALREVREGGDPGLVKHWSRELSFHACGHINHTLFWNMMAPAGKGGGGEPKGAIAAAIAKDFGSFEKFSAHFKAAAGQVEGGGWAWLVYEPVAKKLLVIQEEKQQNMMVTGARPLLGVDVWEHAYYLKYQSGRAAYVEAFMKVVNWGFVGQLFEKAAG